MSIWQNYVDVDLMNNGSFSKAAIIGVQGGTWAASPNFHCSLEESKKLSNGFQAPDQVISILLEGVEYKKVQANQRSIYGVKNADFCICVKTKQAVIVGICNSLEQQPNAVSAIESFADYLIGINY